MGSRPSWPSDSLKSFVSVLAEFLTRDNALYHQIVRAPIWLPLIGRFADERTVKDGNIDNNNGYCTIKQANTANDLRDDDEADEDDVTDNASDENKRDNDDNIG